VEGKLLYGAVSSPQDY